MLNVPKGAWKVCVTVETLIMFYSLSGASAAMWVSKDIRMYIFFEIDI